jgi:16S rRNA (guanine527-N7)-methyltransferase
MEAARINELLRPFLESPPAIPTSPASAALSLSQVENILEYLDLLLRWKSRVNLTAIRQPEEIVTRHFGESLFAAQHLFPDAQAAHGHVVDVGSGAGFPGLPIKIWAPGIRLALIESNYKKGTFLREVVRKLELTDIAVFAKRAEEFEDEADIVTLRAVERFEQAVLVASRLASPGGRLALLIGEGQMKQAKELLPKLEWSDAVKIPHSSSRVLLVGRSPEIQNQSSYESA